MRPILNNQSQPEMGAALFFMAQLFCFRVFLLRLFAQAKATHPDLD